MNGDQAVSIGALVAVVLAVWFARRRAGQKNATAFAASYAKGQADLRAELSASAVANGGSVTLQLGNGGVLTTRGNHDNEHHRASYNNHELDDDYIDNLARAIDDRRRARELRDVRPLYASDGLDAAAQRWGMGAVLDGVQHGRATADADGRALPDGRPARDPGAPDVHEALGA